ncbi:MAG: cytidine deaminase [Candidatus Krumholzibacteriota bacterium]|nr:cytidine deaminase [Candidatus Krumholzibacteriota bacterium]
MDDRTLVERALAAREGAYAPYSRFRVGAALLCEDGEVIEAANLENASLGLSVCAERNAVARAVFTKRWQWRKLAVATDSPDFIPPCGACLQVLAEFTRDLPIILVNARGQAHEVSLRELIPLPFATYDGGGEGGA